MIANPPMPTRAQLRRVAEMTDNNNHTSARIAVASWCADNASNKPDKALFQALHDAFSGIKLVEIWLTHSTIELCELRYALATRLFTAMRDCGLSSAARAFGDCL